MSKIDPEPTFDTIIPFVRIRVTGRSSKNAWHHGEKSGILSIWEVG